MWLTVEKQKQNYLIRQPELQNLRLRGAPKLQLIKGPEEREELALATATGRLIEGVFYCYYFCIKKLLFTQ